MMLGVTFIIAFVCSFVSAEVYFEDRFLDDDWEKRWKQSTWKKSDETAGDFKLTAGKWYADEKEGKGLQTSEDSRFYAYYAELDKKFDTTDKTLVLQFSVKHEQKIDCGGGYIKLLPASSSDQMSNFGGETPYSIMFGPDICGFTKKVHVIFTYKGENYLIKKDISCQSDQLTHLYTLRVYPDNTYDVLLDMESVQKGSLVDDWEMLKPRKIKDPEAKMPDDWDSRRTIVDPDDKKPEDWDAPEKIPDPDAKKPDTWNEEEDGEFEIPLIKNPDYKGEWKPKQIENPDYKGEWSAPMIDNPDFVDDPDLYKFTDLQYLGFELWQVKAGTIFDNILVTDDVKYADKVGEDIFRPAREPERKMYQKLEDELKAKEKEEMEAMGGADMEEDEYEDFGGDGGDVADVEEDDEDLKEEL